MYTEITSFYTLKTFVLFVRFFLSLFFVIFQIDLLKKRTMMLHLFKYKKCYLIWQLFKPVQDQSSRIIPPYSTGAKKKKTHYYIYIIYLLLDY